MALFFSGVQLCASEEGKRNKAYKDSRGIWTIGRGYNLESHGYSKEEAAKQEWDDERIDKEFAASIMRCVDQLNKNWPGWKNLSEVRQAVCLSSVYQLGSQGAAKFVATIDALEDHDFDRAAGQIMLSKWAKQTPARVRRNADMLQHDEWPAQVNGVKFEPLEGCILETVEDIVLALQGKELPTAQDECVARVLPPVRHGDEQEKGKDTVVNVRSDPSPREVVKEKTPKETVIRIPNILGIRISKKLVASLIGVAIIILNHPLGLGLTPMEIDAVKAVVVSYVLSQAGVDLGGPVVGPILSKIKGRFNL